MKAIVLAAGRGTRISEKIGAIPKSTLEINGKPIIRSTVEMLLSMGIKPLICVGFKYQLIQKALEGLDVTYYYNPFFAVTNNIASLWFAREEFDDDMLVLSADVVFPKSMLQRLIDAKTEDTMLVDKARVLDGDYFFQLSKEGCVMQYGPNVPVKQRDCENIGMIKIAKSAVIEYCARMEEIVEAEGYQNYFEQVFFSFMERKEKDIHTVDVDGDIWREIDFFEDYEKIVEILKKQ